jgi:hypothetical protein
MKDALLRDSAKVIADIAPNSSELFKSTLTSTFPDFSISTPLKVNFLLAASLVPSYSSPFTTNLISSIAVTLSLSLRVTTTSHLIASVILISHSATFTLVEPAAALTTHNLVPESLIFPPLNV